MDKRLAPRISRKPFDLESPNFTVTSTPTCSTATPAISAIATSGRKLSWKNCPKCRLRLFQMEFIENLLSEDRQILEIYRIQSASHRCRTRRHYSTFWPAAKYKEIPRKSAQNWCARTWSRIIRLLRNLESPNFEVASRSS